MPSKSKNKLGQKRCESPVGHGMEMLATRRSRSHVVSELMVLTCRSGDDHVMVKTLTDKGLTIFGDNFDSQVMVTVKMLDR